MKKTEEKNFSKKSLLIYSVIALAVVLAIILFASTGSNKSMNLDLTDFEKIAVYGYLEDYLSLDKLYLLAGKSSYDDLHYTRSKIKSILDEQYNSNPDSTIPVSIINSELNDKYSIDSNNIDYHGILVSDYEYMPDQNAFRRVEGANKNMGSLENEVDTVSNSNYELSITNINQVSDNSFVVNFDVVDSSNNSVHQSGNVTVKVIDGTYELENCTIN